MVWPLPRDEGENSCLGSTFLCHRSVKACIFDNLNIFENFKIKEIIKFSEKLNIFDFVN